jgi:hypothetical protein
VNFLLARYPIVNMLPFFLYKSIFCDDSECCLCDRFSARLALGKSSGEKGKAKEGGKKWLNRDYIHSRMSFILQLVAVKVRLPRKEKKNFFCTQNFRSLPISQKRRRRTRRNVSRCHCEIYEIKQIRLQRRRRCRQKVHIFRG